MGPLMWAILSAGVTLALSAVIFGSIFYRVGYKRRKEKAEAEIGSAEEEAKRIREEGAKAAETQRKEALLSAKEEIL